MTFTFPRRGDADAIPQSLNPCRASIDWLKHFNQNPCFSYQYNFIKQLAYRLIPLVDWMFVVPNAGCHQFRTQFQRETGGSYRAIVPSDLTFGVFEAAF